MVIQAAGQDPGGVGDVEELRAGTNPNDGADDGNTQDPHRIERCAGAPEVLWCQHHNGIWRSADNGAQWQRLQAPVSSFGFAVAAHPHDPLTAWFAPAEADQRRVPVGAAMVVNRTRDGGQSFETLRQGLPRDSPTIMVMRRAQMTISQRTREWAWVLARRIASVR